MTKEQFFKAQDEYARQRELGRYICTPRKSFSEERMRFYISAADRAKMGRGRKWKATVTDLDTGKKYILQDADCGAGRCRCDAVVIGEGF